MLLRFLLLSQLSIDVVLADGNSVSLGMTIGLAAIGAILATLVCYCVCKSYLERRSGGEMSAGRCTRRLISGDTDYVYYTINVGDDRTLFNGYKPTFDDGTILPPSSDLHLGGGFVTVHSGGRVLDDIMEEHGSGNETSSTRADSILARPSNTDVHDSIKGMPSNTDINVSDATFSSVQEQPRNTSHSAAHTQ